MITLFLTALDQQANQREFSCRLPSIEGHFNLLNHVVAQRHTLVEAYLVEDKTRTNLPVAAFDGIPVSIAIQALEKEWKAILRQPRLLEPDHHQQELTRQTHHRLKRYATTTLIYEQMINHFNRGIQRAQSDTRFSSANSWLVEYYQSQIVSYQNRLANSRFYTNLMANRISQLTDSIRLCNYL